MDQRDQLPAEKAQLWRGFYAERFPMIATELAAGGPVVAEGRPAAGLRRCCRRSQTLRLARAGARLLGATALPRAQLG